MREEEQIGLLADLVNEHCELNHGPNTNQEDYRATDYIILPIGCQENTIESVTVREMVIPVCFDCAQALLHDEWTLLYCFECSHSRWIYRPLARNSYRHHILWLRGCPDCSNSFGGLYFSDEQRGGSAKFVSSQQGASPCQSCMLISGSVIGMRVKRGHVALGGLGCS